MKKTNQEIEFERLEQRSYAAIIRTREMENTLKLVQRAQTPAHKPAPTKPVAQPVKPVQQPAQPKTPQQPAPPQRPTAPIYSTSLSTASMAIFNWQDNGWSNGGSYACVACARVVVGMHAIDETLGQGRYQAGQTWLSRVDRCEERCSICQRRIE